MTTVRDFRHSLLFQLIAEKIEANAIAAGIKFREAVEDIDSERADQYRLHCRYWDQAYENLHCAFLVKSATVTPGFDAF